MLISIVVGSLEISTTQYIKDNFVTSFNGLQLSEVRLNPREVTLSHQCHLSPFTSSYFPCRVKTYLLVAAAVSRIKTTCLFSIFIIILIFDVHHHQWKTDTQQILSSKRKLNTTTGIAIEMKIAYW